MGNKNIKEKRRRVGDKEIKGLVRVWWKFKRGDDERQDEAKMKDRK